MIAASSATALAARAGHAMGSFDWGLIAAFAPTAVLGTLAGTKAAGRIRSQQLSAAFTVLITLAAAFTLARSVPRIAWGLSRSPGPVRERASRARLARRRRSP